MLTTIVMARFMLFRLVYILAWYCQYQLSFAKN